MTKNISNSLEETQKIASDFVSSISKQKNGATVAGLYGDLGAGKTTFTQMIAKAFGVTDTVISPTFVIMKVYDISYTSNPATHNHNFNNLIHLDAYRIENSSELLHLGWKEIISDPNNLILIEWPERVSDIMPLRHIKINLRTLGDRDHREILIQ